MLPALAPYLTRPEQQLTQVSAGDWLVIVSQTCDVVAHKLDAEPFVEVLHCRPYAGKPRRQFRDLQSTRHLDFRPHRADHPNLVLTAHAIADRYLIPRDLLAVHDPDANRSLDVGASKKILAWYALRAGRPSWPNNFCDRLKTAQVALEEALDDLSDEIAEVRVSILEKDLDLPPGQVYHVVAFFVVDEEVWKADVAGRKTINQAFAKFVTELDACDGIVVNKELSEVVSGSKFSWQDTKQTDLWDFANLSHRD